MIFRLFLQMHRKITEGGLLSTWATVQKAWTAFGEAQDVKSGVTARRLKWSSANAAQKSKLVLAIERNKARNKELKILASEKNRTINKGRYIYICFVFIV